MGISTEAIKEVRSRTGVGILECKDALLKAEGSVEKAVEILRGRGLAVAEEKTKRVATEGLIEAYVHHSGRLGALVEVNCETDFVAHTGEFKELAHNLAMQVAATSPRFIGAEEMPPGTDLEPEVVCLLLQPFIKEPSKTVREVIAEAVAKMGENIKVSRFVRFELGELGR